MSYAILPFELVSFWKYESKVVTYGHTSHQENGTSTRPLFTDDGLSEGYYFTISSKVYSHATFMHSNDMTLPGLLLCTLRVWACSRLRHVLLMYLLHQRWIYHSHLQTLHHTWYHCHHLLIRSYHLKTLPDARHEHQRYPAEVHHLETHSIWSLQSLYFLRHHRYP